MDALNMVVPVPAWAYDFCHYYLAVAAVIVVYSLYSMVQLFMLPATVKKMVPVTGVALSLLLSGGFSVLMAMMQFWICRSALAPKMEKFAVTCKSVDDCTAVAGPQKPGSLCTCGKRGFCAGCTMDNNVEPSMMPEYDQPLAGVKEGFMLKH